MNGASSPVALGQKSVQRTRTQLYTGDPLPLRAVFGQNPALSQPVESPFDCRLPLWDRTDLGHGLTPMKDGDRPSLPNVPQDFRETCLGFICGVADIHGPYYN